MADDPLQLLEDELVAAAARRARMTAAGGMNGAAPAGRHTNGAAPQGRGDGGALARARRRLGLAAGAVAVLVPLAIGLGALALLHGRHQGSRRATSAGAGAPVALLAVLRRPQTAGDLRGASAIQRSARARGLVIDRRLLRRVSVTLVGAGPQAARRASGARKGVGAMSADEVTVSLVVARHGGAYGVALAYEPSGRWSYPPLGRGQSPSAGTTSTQAATTPSTTTTSSTTTTQTATASTVGSATTTIATTTAAAPGARAPSVRDFVLPLQSIILGQFASAAQIKSRGIVQPVGLSITDASEVVVLVPDGVRRVRFAVAGQRGITASVHNNLAGFLVSGTRFAAQPDHYEMTWYGRGGQVLRVVRSAATNPTAPPASSQLALLEGVMPVFARPARAADRDVALAKVLASPYSEALVGTPDLALLRRATRTPWGATVYLVAVDAARRPRAPATQGCDPATGVCETIDPVVTTPGLFSDHPPGWGVGVYLSGSPAQTAGRDFGCCEPASAIPHGEAAWALRTRTGERLLALAPAQAAFVQFVLASGAIVVARVHGDVAAASFPRVAALRRVTFFDARGRALVYHG
jgi:hypothetical protein